jgi:hypothetical protein
MIYRKYSYGESNSVNMEEYGKEYGKQYGKEYGRKRRDKGEMVKKPGHNQTSPNHCFPYIALPEKKYEKTPQHLTKQTP